MLSDNQLNLSTIVLLIDASNIIYAAVYFMQIVINCNVSVGKGKKVGLQISSWCLQLATGII